MCDILSHFYTSRNLIPVNCILIEISFFSIDFTPSRHYNMLIIH